MAHKEQVDFCLKVKEKFPWFFKNKIVVDIGSLDINGSNRYLFENCLYIGIDIGVGKNVDFVCKGHELRLPDESVDVIISTECFEHDMYYEETLKNIYRMLKPGGFFIFSCATTGRKEHGTRRKRPNSAPLLPEDNNWSDYYKNLVPSDIQNVYDIENFFSIYYFEINNVHFDMFFYGIKSGTYNIRDNYSFLLGDQKLDRLIHYETYSQLYVSDIDGHFDEQKSRTSVTAHNVFNIYDLINTKQIKLRFDPSTKKCIICNIQCWLIDDNNEEYECSIISHNAVLVKNGRYYFDTDDPQLYLSTPILNPTHFKFNFDLEDLSTNEYFQTYKCVTELLSS